MCADNVSGGGDSDSGSGSNGCGVDSTGRIKLASLIYFDRPVDNTGGRWSADSVDAESRTPLSRLLGLLVECAFSTDPEIVYKYNLFCQSMNNVEIKMHAVAAFDPNFGQTVGWWHCEKKPDAHIGNVKGFKIGDAYTGQTMFLVDDSINKYNGWIARLGVQLSPNDWHPKRYVWQAMRRALDEEISATREFFAKKGLSASYASER